MVGCFTMGATSLVQRHIFALQRKRMGSSVSNSTVFTLASSSKVCSSGQPDTVSRWSVGYFLEWKILPFGLCLALVFRWVM